MNTKKLDSILEEIKGAILLDLMHAVEDLTAAKPAQCLLSSEESRLLDYLFADGLYPIDEDREYWELGDIFTEDE
jgi:hypothetical protein